MNKGFNSAGNNQSDSGLRFKIPSTNEYSHPISMIYDGSKFRFYSNNDEIKIL
jgi:hypothetical protein